MPKAVVLTVRCLVAVCLALPVSAHASFQVRLADSALVLTKQHVVYDPSYFRIAYPNGDVPPGKGVCTDVVIRAYRKLGIDLQKEVHEDMKAAFARYPQNWGLSKPDPNIDHRRVPNLMTFFGRHGTVLPITRDAQAYQPGDVVCWNLGGGITHIGIVSRKRSADGQRPLIVHNIGAGQVLEDCLFKFTVIGHYRYGKKWNKVSSDHRGSKTMARDIFDIMRTGLFVLLLVSAGVTCAQQPDTVHVAGNWYSYIVGVHSKKGVYSGHVEYFDSTWTLRKRGFAQKGKMEGLVEYFDTTGTLSRKGIARRGRMEGLTTDYRPDGRIWMETPYHKGKVEGMVRVFHANGKLAMEANFEEGKMNGEQLVWDSTGTAANGDVTIDTPGGGTTQVSCVNGRAEGNMIGKRKDGNFYAIGTFHAGLPEVFIYYDRNGTPVGKDLFKQGRFVKSVPLNQYP